MKNRTTRHGRERVSFTRPLSDHSWDEVKLDPETKNNLYELKNLLVKEGK